MGLINTYTASRLDPYINPEEAMNSIVHVNFAPNLTLAKGTILGKITATGKYAAYDNGAATGVETALPLITQYAVTTNADGNVTNFDQWGGVDSSAPCYTRGDFRTEDLANLDAAAVTDIKATIVTGNTTTGHLKF
jgi:hypothetical protein